MKSIYGGCGTGDTRLHMVQYFDGQRIREIELMTLEGRIYWVEKTIPGILEVGQNYRTAKRRLAALERRCSSRIG